MKAPSILVAVLLIGSNATAGLLPYPERALKYDGRSDWDSILQRHWVAWKDSFLGTDGFVHGHTPEGTPASTSVNQGYGLLLSAWFGDEAAFKSLWDATSKFLTPTREFQRIYQTPDSANDGGADQDIAGALMMASALQDSGYWKDTTFHYRQIAVLQVKALRDRIVSNSYVPAFVGASRYNPSALGIHWHALFRKFAARNGVTGADWNSVHRASMAVINKQPHADKGMVRDWSNEIGGSAGYGDNMSFQAIRVPWQMALSNMWDHDSAAGAWCTRVWNEHAVDPEKPGFYKLELPPYLFGWSDASYSHEMTRAMWGACASSVRDSTTNAKSAASAITDSLVVGLGKKPLIVSGPKNSYAEALALMGALTIAGRAWNVWDDLMNPWTVPDTSTKFVSPLKVLPDSVLAVGGDSVRVTAKLSKSIAWRVTFTGKSSGATFSKVGNGDSISFHWKPTQSAVGARFKPESVTVVVSGAWATTPEAGKATIRLLPDPTTSVSNRLVRDGFAWSGRRLVFPASLVRDGELCRVRIMDLAGRTLVPSSTLEAHQDGDRAWIVPGEARTGMRILDLETSRGRFRGILPPVR